MKRWFKAAGWLFAMLAAIYLYATEGTVPGPFEPELLEGAFRAK